MKTIRPISVSIAVIGASVTGRFTVRTAERGSRMTVKKRK